MGLKNLFKKKSKYDPCLDAIFHEDVVKREFVKPKSESKAEREARIKEEDEEIVRRYEEIKNSAY